MKVYLIRHVYYSADEDLSESGRKQVLDAADFLKQQNLDFAQIRLLTSDLRRALSSTEIIKTTLGLTEHAVAGWLINGTKSNIPDLIDTFFQENPECRIVVAVGHMPEIERAVDAYARRFGVKFSANAKNGSVHFVDTETKEVAEIFCPS